MADSPVQFVDRLLAIRDAAASLERHLRLAAQNVPAASRDPLASSARSRTAEIAAYAKSIGLQAAELERKLP